MNIDIKKWTPWNWFKGEQQQEGRQLTTAQSGVRAGWPVPYGDHPLWALHREMDRAFDGFFRRFEEMMPVPFASTALFKPSLDIREDKKRYKITLEVPGVEEGDIRLALQDGVLTISGEKRYERESQEEDAHFVERSYGVFRRVLDLPQDSMTDGIAAQFKNGVLTITIPRMQTAKPKEEGKVIPINKAA